MAPTPCALCTDSRAVIIRPKNHQKLCRACFISLFEREIHETITSSALFQPGERIAIGASGGKDSTVLASVLKTLNDRYNYGLKLLLLSVDEGIKGYRDDSLETVKRNAVQYDMPLEIVGYDELYGWTMDQVVAQVGKKGNCTYCGVFRRQALDRGAAKLGIKHVVTGHNADDVAETVMMNLLRGDLPRLARATSILTASPASDIKRSKPLKYAYEKEIVLYAHHKQLDYFSTECIYSPEAFRGSARTLIKDLEKIRPSSILDIVRSGEDMARLVPPELLSSSSCDGGIDGEEGATSGCGSTKGRSGHGEMVDMEKRLAENEAASTQETEVTLSSANDRPRDAVQAKPKPKPFSIHDKRQKGRRKAAAQQMGKCERCGYLSSQTICKACLLLEGLNRNRPKTTIEIGVEDEDSSTTLMRQVASLEIPSAWTGSIEEQS
ncbi:Cytoplasmic tRNA 2-thiolation protein 1 [Endocarpon pusillum Z07020]|uniref:Cytoplasmic tRNA 2-thiolation protein 1 n=1 Tax=Endocarpon pusillum (strain Z07020 / HMAS-L-300199) TaxID=1263415 RepID=U1GPI9_ENDPU|nr:Cytoplasmic tRNA 2-thiolation protein 1 [Endocarpon pusillum Z07020]ERF74213.1 Cytoplasmic tRNA 2-thiolation protein 1 [Endocarpon pusillum Z07020]